MVNQKCQNTPFMCLDLCPQSALLKKLSIEFYETQDLSSTNGKPELLFYDYSWHIFSLQPIAEGNCGATVEIKS